jgi:hypothetical protein
VKIQKFQLDKGKYVVVASYINLNDTTKAEEETTIKTDESPRPALRQAIADLSLAVVTHYRLTEHKLKIYKVTFHSNKDGQSAKFFIRSIDEEDAIPIGPLFFERAEETLPSSTDRKPDSTKNIIFDQLEKTEKLMEKYVGGEREQPKLPEKKVEIEARPQGRFGFIKDKIAKGGKAKTPAAEQA